jgi:hypothetical protein
MVTQEKRRASALTLADKSAELKREILRQFGPANTGSPAARLPEGLPAHLPGELPALPEPQPGLGRPLDLRGVAGLIGCSPWTVRQKLIPMGLPHFRSGASGKLIFYEAQIVRWIQHKQTQGGKPR